MNTHLGGLLIQLCVPDGIVVGEVHSQVVNSYFPDGSLGSRDLAFPLEHVGGAVGVGGRFGDEAKGMIFPPLCSFLFETVDYELIDLCGSLHLSNISIGKLTAIYIGPSNE